MTGNLGVSALCYATMRALYAEVPALDLAVLDDGLGHRLGTLAIDGRPVAYRCLGERLSRRYWRPESLFNIRLSARLGGFINPTARALCRADAVLDISGGDSFTDLYGPKRFRAVTLLKHIVLENRIPLILLPQTYGPFGRAKNRQVAESIVRRSTMAWARDERSFAVLKQLAGRDFDPVRHRCGVDVAFGLEALPPEDPLPVRLADWLKERAMEERPVVGINVSGLIYNDAAGASQQYGLKADYRAVIHGLADRLLKESDCRILLIPHVITPKGHYESDVDACAAVAQFCGQSERVHVLPALADPRNVKWVIAQMDWFCGTRMHATIAGLSSGVPTAAIAYSLKTLGVFETCGQGTQVADPRSLETGEMVAQLYDSFLHKKRVREELANRLPTLAMQLSRQQDTIISQLHGCQKRSN